MGTIYILEAEDGGVKRRELTLRIDPASYEQLRRAAFALGITKQQAVSEALVLWLEARAKKVAAYFEAHQ